GSESPLRGFDSGLLLIGVIAFLLNVVMAVIASGFIRKPFAEIAALKEAAEANSRAKSGFLANMSHEIRTPLNAVVGLSELAMAEEKPGSERADKLEKIHSSGMTILNIINDILDISKVEAGKFEIIPAEYEVASMINDVVSQNAVRIGSKPIRFILDIDRNLPARLVGDELRVKQIINNLLSNAFKYTEEGMVTLGLLCEREGDGVVMTLRVADTGCGIREKDIDALFIDYARMDIETNRKIGGTGLGLPITKMLAEMMGGRVSVESDYGKGSVFTAVIRQRPAGDATIGAETAENLKRFRYAYDAQRAAGRLNRIQLPLARVLVVDDNITNLDIAKGIMKPYGMRVDCVTGGQQAVDAIRAGTPEYDAIFMDHMMPEMDGVEATRRIRALGTAYAENIPVIALTANALTGNEAMFLRNGFQAFISKPIDLARLDEVIRSFVRDRKGEEGPIGEEKTAGEGSVKRENAAAEKNGEKSGRAFRDFGSGIAGLNVSSGLERFGGEKTFMRILRSYAVNTKSLVESIRTVDTGNLAAYATTIHGIKGSSRNICALPLGDRAEALERAAKSGDADFVIRNNPAVIETVETLIREIEAALLAVEKANPRPRKAAPEVGILLRLRDACDDFDFDGIESAMEEIDLYEYEADDGLAAWLRENVLKMNFASISDRLASLSREK
ncbi:MAG: response regulator, partial [Planctomycetota bacterium]|nr:response regulator [Planctomycetota bacterium]